jgi:hydrogenase large subunit
MKISSNLIENYQVVTPSAWNMSPRDESGQPGPVEQALTGVHVADPKDPVEVNHIIRSFDPCMSCTVH